MRKGSNRLIVLILILSISLTACSGSGNGDNKSSNESNKEIKDLVVSSLMTREIGTFNILYTQKDADLDDLTNLVDGLVEVDREGKLVPAIAKEWGTDDDGLTWTFNLRDGVKWVDVNGEEKAECISDDFANGLEWVLNFHKNDSVNTSMPVEMIEGAEEYYEWTKGLSAEEAKELNGGKDSKFREMVGVDLPDDKTISYRCIAKKPYFDTVAAYVCLYSLPQGMVDELGGADGVKAMNNTNMWYNGAYTMTSYVQGNEKVFTKNPKYWDEDCDRFETVTRKMVESNDVAFQLYESGEIDYVQLTESSLNTIYRNEDNKFHDYLVPDVSSKFSFQIHFNYNKKNKDGSPDDNWNKAVANTAFRKAWLTGLDLESYYRRINTIDPYLCENNYYTMKGLVYTSDGRDYVDLVREELGLEEPDGKKMARLDKDKAEAYKKQAMEELGAEGVTFPVEVDYYAPASDQNALDTANVLKQIFSDSLGDDFVKFNLKTFVTKQSAEVIEPHLHSFLISEWAADYGDPQNFLSQEVPENDNAFYARNYSYSNEIDSSSKELLDIYSKFTDMVKEANTITEDMDERYRAYAKAEAYMIENALVIPTHYKNMWALSKVDNSSRMNGMFGVQNEKIKNWKTNVDGYKTEEAENLDKESK